MRFRCRWIGPAALAMTVLLHAAPAVGARIAADAARMTIGDPQAGHIDILVNRRRGSDRPIVISTYRVGAPGSRFTLSINGRPVVMPIILSEAQCRFDAAGSRCDIRIGRRDRAFQPLLAAFRRGRQALVTVQNAGNLAMSRKVSLRPLQAAARRL